MDLNDTIAAVATPPGRGGIGIIRLSGPEAESIARRLFRTTHPIPFFHSHHLYHGDIVSLKTGAVLDEVLLTLMKAPHSYTGEDVAEIHGHGSPMLLQALLAEVLQAGARPADPGEFTRRAFLNGRMDLTQAEAVADLINAASAPGAGLALDHLKGRLGRTVEALYTKATEILVYLEAAIDFTEEEATLDTSAQTVRLNEILETVNTLLCTYAEGKISREGIRAVIIGRPNVGKSSLLNRLLGEKRAIVTPIPGTTRDFIEETLTIQGLPICLTDTAGIRDPENIIEEAGIAMVREKMARADGVILILDGSMPLTREDETLLRDNGGPPCIVVVNKADLPQVLKAEQIQSLRPESDLRWISAKTGEGIDALKDFLYRLLAGDRQPAGGGTLIGNPRHKLALEGTLTHLQRAHDGLKRRVSPELIVLDIRDALKDLGQIIGRTTPPDVLEQIFASFCIGK